MAELTELFSPIKVGNCEIRNRILINTNLTDFNRNGMPSDSLVSLIEARARGGAGLIVLEAAAVSPLGWPGPSFAMGWKDEIVHQLRKISEVVHKHGVKVFCQAVHIGNIAFAEKNTRNVSEVPIRDKVPAPAVVAEIDVEEVIQKYVDLSLKLKEAGFDGMEIHGSHNYLPQQFLSPRLNVRKDQYGGSLENRMRFGLELIDAVRKAVGGDFVIGLRVCADELAPGGLTLDDIKDIFPIWDQTRKIDFLDVDVANYKKFATVVDPAEDVPRPFIHAASETRKRVDVPVFASHRVIDTATAYDIIKNNEADMVVMEVAGVSRIRPKMFWKERPEPPVRLRHRISGSQ